MNINKLIFVTFLSVLFSGISAQRIYKEKNGNKRIILDLTEMPGATITSTPKYTGTYVGDNSKFIVNKHFSDRENERVFQQLEIASEDLNVLSNKLTWDKAFDGCRNISVKAGESKWRLPTQRELYLIWIFREQINEFCAPVLFESVHYWSVTESANDKAYYLHFYAGDMDDTEKNYKNMVRCVREVTP